MSDLPLSGIRVADFCHGWAGPYMTNLLADFGAEVIKIESKYGSSNARTPDPARGNYSLAEFHRNKLGTTLNMNMPEAVEIAKQLIKISDVVTENFSLRVMKKWGLDYEHVREINPGIIMASLQGLGQTGPHKDYVTWGPNLMPLTGMTYEWGFPDLPKPSGTKMAYPDFVAGVHGACAIVAALNYRSQTGKGQYIDLAQLEATAAMMPVVFLDYTANGRIQERNGNRSRDFAPQGCYRCQGEDEWCMISVTTQEQWESFCHLLGNPLWTQDERFSTMRGRIRHADELDERIEEWTQTQTPRAVMEKLQAAGIPAGIVHDARSLIDDPHLNARNSVIQIDHPGMGNVLHANVPMRLSKTPGTIERPAPEMGEHNDYVFRGLLGLSSKDIEELGKRGVFE